MRSVLFIDPPAFCTTVEVLAVPALRGRPLAVAPPGADRAVVLALSGEARAAGLERGMAVKRARRMCPDLVLLPPNPRLYARASRALHEILRVWAPVIEPRWYGHAYLDLTGTGRLFGPPVDVAWRIAREAQARLGLPLTVGVAANKLVSEAAARLVEPDDGAPARCEPPLHVPGGEEAGFLAPHPVSLLPDLPERVRERLDDYQLDLIGEVAAISEAALCSVLGAPGRSLRAHARGIDPRPVLPPERRAELRAAHILATDTNELAVLHPLLGLLAERVGAVLRRRGLAARRLAVTLAYADYDTAQARLPLGADPLDAELARVARHAFTKAHRRRTAVREVGVVAEDVVESGRQLELWDDADRQGTALPTRPPAAGTGAMQAALDRIRTRWGTRAVRWGDRCA